MPVRAGQPCGTGHREPGVSRALPSLGCLSHGAGLRGALPVAWPAPGAAAAEAVPGGAAPLPAAVGCIPAAQRTPAISRSPREASRLPACGAHSRPPPPCGADSFSHR